MEGRENDGTVGLGLPIMGAQSAFRGKGNFEMGEALFRCAVYLRASNTMQEECGLPMD